MMQPTSGAHTPDPQQQQLMMMMQQTPVATPAIDSRQQQQQWMMMQPTPVAPRAIDPQQQQRVMMMQPPPQAGFWAAFGVGEKPPKDYSIFVGDLAFDVTDYLLQETFQVIYPSVKGAKVVIDSTTGRSEGYGFVIFGDENEQLRAMTEMNGKLCSSRPMRIMRIRPVRRKKTGQSYPQPQQSYPQSR